MTMRRAKIVCTLGPASSSYEQIKTLISGGMDVARINCSHSSHAMIKELVGHVRKASDELARHAAVLLDLQGPKLRIGTYPRGPVSISAGNEITISIDEKYRDAGDDKFIYTTYKEITRDVEKGDRILIDDGHIELRVKSATSTEVLCEIITGGKLSNKKGMNLPGVTTSIPSLTDKDREDLLYGLKQDVDYVALSFVRQPSDIRDVQKIIHAQLKATPVIAKIEKPEAVDCIDDIIAVTDAVMIARGDMAVELSPEQVPSIQKQIIHKCNVAGIPVIVATQMLDSMQSNPRPTRAEASDVANAVFDGGDALMLSNETAAGDYPARALEVMTNIIHRAEKDREKLHVQQPEMPPVVSIADAIEYSASEIAENSGAKAICCLTNTGKGAQALSKFRPDVPIFALTDRKVTLQKLGLIWGVKGILIPSIVPTEDIFTTVEDAVVKWWNTYLSHVYRPLENGDILVVTVGIPTMARSKTNTVKVHTIALPE